MPTHDPSWPEPFRGKLLLFGQQLLQSRFQGKLDVAGVVQKTLLEAGAVPPPNPHPVAQEAWLRAILRNNFQDEVCRLTAAKRDVKREVPLGSEELLAKDDSPSRKVVRSEERRRLLNHVTDLPEDQRAAIQGRYIDGLSIEALALKLGKTELAVKGLLRRGLQALRDRLRRDSPRGSRSEM